MWNSAFKSRTGRYVGGSPKQRLCKLCSSDVHIENELYFLLLCPYYTDIRNQFLDDKLAKEYVLQLSDGDKNDVFVT
jgi:hypothetical protein